MTPTETHKPDDTRANALQEDASPRPPMPGEVAHWLRTGVTHMQDHRETSGAVSVRGEEFIVTEAMIEANRDGAGKSFLDLLHDQEGQRATYGRALVGPGPWDPAMERTEPGTREHDDARREALDAVRQIPDKEERATATKRVAERFGPSGVTSKTLANYSR